MIIMNNKDGSIIPFTDCKILNSNTLKLVDGNTEYIVASIDIENKLNNGGSIEDADNVRLPIIYDTSHGPLTNESVLKYGVEVIITHVLDIGYPTLDMYFEHGDR